MFNFFIIIFFFVENTTISSSLFVDRLEETFLFRQKKYSGYEALILFSPAQVYLCHDNYPWQERVEAAETLAYLTEINVELQRLASISNHLIAVLATFVNYKGDSSLPAAKSEEIRKELIQAAFRVSICEKCFFFLKYFELSMQWCAYCRNSS